MDCSTIVYHASPVNNLTQFELGVRLTGETDDPVNGIWLGTSYDGACWHATSVVGRIRNLPTTYIYECQFVPGTVIANAKDKEMPDCSWTLFQQKFVPGWRKALSVFFPLKNEDWFHKIMKIAKRDSKYGGYNGSMNALISVCRECGIDVLVHPSTDVSQNGELQHWDEGVYGDVLLLLDCEKAVILREYTV